MCFLIFCHTNSSYIKRKNVSRERINMYKDNKKHFDEITFAANKRTLTEQIK